MNKDSRILVAGHTGLVGSAFVRRLKSEGYTNIITRTHSELDLTDQSEVKDFFLKEQPEFVILSAGRVGGIIANSSYPAEFIYTNLQIFSNVIHSSWLSKVRKLMMIGSSCIYPRISSKPLSEDMLLTAPVEPTSEPFAIAKIAGIRMCQSYNRQYGTDFISPVFTNLYGPGDDFNPDTSHLVPGLIRKFHHAKMTGSSSVELWGTGTPRREFMHVDDAAEAGVFLMNNYNDTEIINVGLGTDMAVKEYGELVKKVIGFDGEILFDTSRPDGAPQKLLDSSKMRKLGWTPKIDIVTGIKSTYEWYLKNYTEKAGVGRIER